MPGKLYYITRTWAEETEARGAALLRRAYAELLQPFMPVVIVTPKYDSKVPCVTKNQISFPYVSRNKLSDTLFQYARIKEDYLDTWVRETFVYLKDRVSSEDVLYAVTGGELATIKLGALLKEKTGCRLIIHFCDPVDGIKMFGEKIHSYYGFNRDKVVHKYVVKGDLWITSSETYQTVLREQYPKKQNQIYNHYMGYLKQVSIKEKKAAKTPMNIVFSGTATAIQNTDILYKALRGRNDIKVTYICSNATERKKMMPENNIECRELMPHAQFLEYMEEEADVGFVGLKGKYLGACVPSRLYEFLNLGLPILASLPEGSAKEIIDKNGYGIVCRNDKIEALREAAVRLTDKIVYEEYLLSVRREREKWFFKNRAKEFTDIIGEFL